MRRALLLAPVLALVLAGCSGGDPVAERREAVAEVTDAANRGDAAGLREAVADLLSVLRAQVASREVDRAEADRLRVIAERIVASADLVAPAPSPVPTVEVTEEPSPEPTEEPSPEPTEEPSPEPTDEPEETEEPEPEETEEPLPPVLSPPVTQSSPTPAQVGQSSPRPAASPQPTA